MGLVIDTSAPVALERVGEGWERLLKAVAAEPVALPAIVYAELLVGVALADSQERAAARRAKIYAPAGAVDIVPFDADVAARWAELFALLRGAGQI